MDYLKKLNDGSLVIDSVKLAEVLKLRKNNLDQKISNLIIANPELRNEFVKTLYLTNGREYPCYNMTRKGLDVVVGTLTIQPYANLIIPVMKEWNELTRKDSDVPVKEKEEVVKLVSKAELLVKMAGAIYDMEKQIEGINNIIKKNTEMPSDYPKYIKDEVFKKIEILNEREELVWRVNHYCAISGKNQQDVWSDIYNSFYASTGKVIQPANKRESRLQAIFREGLIKNLKEFVIRKTFI